MWDDSRPRHTGHTAPESCIAALEDALDDAREELKVLRFEKAEAEKAAWHWEGSTKVANHAANTAHAKLAEARQELQRVDRIALAHEAERDAARTELARERELQTKAEVTTRTVFARNLVADALDYYREELDRLRRARGEGEG